MKRALVILAIFGFFFAFLFWRVETPKLLASLDVRPFPVPVATTPKPAPGAHPRAAAKPAKKAVAKAAETSDTVEFRQAAPARWGIWESTQMEEWIERGEPCALLHSKVLADAPLSQIISHLNAYASGEPGGISGATLQTLAEMMSAESEEEFFAAVGDSQEIIVRLYEALALAGELEGLRTAPPVDYLRAAEILARIHPPQENGAIPLALAYLRRKLGATPAEVKPLVQAALRAPIFTFYTQEVTYAVFARGLQNSSIWPLAQAFREYQPIPNHGWIRFLLREQLGDPQLAQAAYDWGVRVMRKNEENAALPEIAYWLMIEHTTGHGVAKDAWFMLHPGKELPAEANTDSRTLMANLIKRNSGEGNWGKSEADCRKYYPKAFAAMVRENEAYGKTH